jgi:hypothetical protein
MSGEWLLFNVAARLSTRLRHATKTDDFWLAADSSSASAEHGQAAAATSTEFKLTKTPQQFWDEHNLSWSAAESVPKQRDAALHALENSGLRCVAHCMLVAM